VRASGSSITRIETINDETLPDNTDKPDVIPNGLLSLRIETPEYGRTVQLQIHLSEPTPENAYWIMYDELNGWYDYSDYATFDAARSRVTLDLQDGGHGDGDYTENGIIVDPGGIALRSEASDIVTRTETKTGCFINMLIW
jgi:hypothetical protein